MPTIVAIGNKIVDTVHGHRKLLAMGKVSLRPSKKFMALITLHGSLNAAVLEWRVPYMTVRDWIDGRHQLSGDVIARIVEASGHAYDDLFEHSTPRTRRRAARK